MMEKPQGEYLMRISEYCVVYDRQPDEFEIKVNEKLKEGWQPYQGIVIELVKPGIFYQAMVKYQKHCKHIFQIDDSTYGLQDPVEAICSLCGHKPEAID